MQRLVHVHSPLFGQNADEIKKRAKHVVAGSPLFSDAGSTPAASTNSRPLDLPVMMTPIASLLATRAKIPLDTRGVL